MPAAVAKKKTCFVIGPIGDAESDVRIHADWLLEEIIQPVFADFADYQVVRADQIAQPGMIDAQIIRNLIDAELVIADLSTLNPNAFYEIGIRHMVQKPIIHVQLSEDKIPFDVSLYRATKFSRTRPADLRRARDELKAAVSAVCADGYQVDNPVTRAKGQIRLEQHASPEQKVLLDNLKALHTRIERLENENVVERESFFRSGRHEFGYIVIDLELEHKNDLNTLRDMEKRIMNEAPVFIESYSVSPEEVRLKVPLEIIWDGRANKFAREIIRLPGVKSVRYDSK